jgi:nucleoside-diphosphate-sugar epimerase
MINVASSDQGGVVRPVLVTGGAGYIGSYLVRALLAQHRPVRVLDSLLYGDDALADVRFDPNFELVEADFRDADAVRRALAGAGAVIHLGAIVGDPACAIDEEQSLSTNVEGTQVLADEARAQGIDRFVFASTCSVYGASHEALDETSTLNPVSLYANTKIAAEQLLLERASDSFAPVILRFGTAFGGSHRPRYDLVVNLLTAKAVSEGRITIHGGDQWRPFIHAFDIARAVLLALDAPRDRVASQVINVGADENNYRIGEIGEAIQRLVPSASVATSNEVTDKRNYYVQFTKARELLGFTATLTIEDGVREMVGALTDGTVREYRDPVYHNVITLSELFAERAKLSRMASIANTWHR